MTAPRRRTSPDLRAREVLAYVVGGVLLAIVMSWPLAMHLGERIPQDVIDPLNQTWQLAWGGHALRTAPASVWQGNTFFPLPDSLAFSDSLLGYAPISVLLSRGPGGALTAYNVAFITAYALCFVGATLLARELGARASAAVVAGVAFAYAPWRMTHNGHLNILSIGGIALALFLLLRGYRRHRTGVIAAGWAVAAWQLTIGFAMGLFFAYLLMSVGAVTAAWWLRAGRPAVPRAAVVGTVVGGVVFLLTAGVFAQPYLRVTDRYPEVARTIDSVDFFSPPPKSLLAAPGESRVWGERTTSVREALPFAPEQALFPGLLVPLLAVIGLAFGRMSRGWRAALGVGAVVTAVLAMGTRLGLTRAIYVFLFDHAPGWDAVRTPGRIYAFTALALALLAAVGAHAVQDLLLARYAGRHTGARGSDRRGPVLGVVVGGALAAVVFAEGMPALPLPDAPARPAGLDVALADESRMHLPTDFFHDAAYMYFSTASFPPIANGSTSISPPPFEQLRQQMQAFPDPMSVAALRERGIRAVVLHLDRAPGTPWADAVNRPIDGLGLSREAIGDLVVYRLT